MAAEWSNLKGAGENNRGCFHLLQKTPPYESSMKMDSSLFVDSNDRLFMKVRPFTGKYAARSDDFFLRVDELQRSKMEVGWKYFIMR